MNKMIILDQSLIDYFVGMQFPYQSSVYNKESKRHTNKAKGRHGLTQQKKQEIREAFELFDTDGSGFVNFSILVSLCIYKHF